MRYQQHHILSSSSSSGSSKGRQRSLMPTAVAALLCLLLGYWWGSSSRPDPYPVDMTAFLPPAFDTQPPTHPHHTLAPSSSSRSRSSSSTGGSSSTGSSSSSNVHLSSMDTFAQRFVQQCGLLESRPPVKSGRSGNSNYTVVPYQILSWYPRIILYPNFLDKHTTDYIKQLAAPKLEQSSLGVGGVATETTGQDVRTSMGAFLNRYDDPQGVLKGIEQKIADVTFIPPSHGEDFNVLRYQSGQHYHMHMDTFDSRALKKMDPQFGQRMATMIMYLNDVEEGGETVFKAEGKYGAVRAANMAEKDVVGCKDTDFKYKPRQGDAVLFFSLNPDLNVNPRAIHGACPVEGTSEKWVMTKWMHDKPMVEWDGEMGR